VLADLAPVRLLRGLPAAPPHLTRVLTRVSATRPVVVLFLQVFFTTFFTDLLVIFYPEPLVFKFLNSCFEFAILKLCTLGSFISLIILVSQLS
jgi:hypothetical protein